VEQELIGKSHRYRAACSSTTNVQPRSRSSVGVSQMPCRLFTNVQPRSCTVLNGFGLCS
jgi:hypothetical protein